MSQHLVESLREFMARLYPDYDVVVRHEARTVRVRKPTVVITADVSRHEPYTIGYQGMIEETVVEVLFIYPSGEEGIQSVFAKSRSDMEKLRLAVMAEKRVAGYMVLYLDEQTYRDTYRMPGFILSSVRLRAVRLSVPCQ